MQKYGQIIRQERLNNNMSADVLANILLMDEDMLKEVEEGRVDLSDVRLNICANIFHLSKESMLQGIRQDALTDSEIRQRLEQLTYQVGNTGREKTFGEQVDEVLQGTYPRYEDLKIGNTPQILLDVGCEQLPILYAQRHLRMAIKPQNRELDTHGIKIEQIKNIYASIEHPAVIYDSLTRNDSLVVVSTELDANRNPIVVSIRPNGQGRYEAEIVTSNFATSIYGREEIGKHMEAVVNSGNLLFYDKKKSQMLFSVLGLEFPKGLNSIDSNIIIRKSNHLVKGETEEVKISEKMSQQDVQPRM